MAMKTSFKSNLGKKKVRLAFSEVRVRKPKKRTGMTAAEKRAKAKAEAEEKKA